MSVAAARELAARAGVPLQYFANRSDKVGGSTLGNLAMAQAVSYTHLLQRRAGLSVDGHPGVGGVPP